MQIASHFVLVLWVLLWTQAQDDIVLFIMP